MDFLNKAFAQFNDLFRSMSPGGRITAGLLLVVAVVSVGYLFQAQVGGGDEYLFGGMAIEGQTLQKMELAFGKNGLKGFTIEGSHVKVPRAKRDDYLAALAGEKVFPHNFGDGMKEAAEGSFTDLPAQREHKWTLSTELEMSAQIRKWKGLQDASVIIKSLPPAGLGQPGRSTAGVTAEAIGGERLNREQVRKIRYYVAAAAGMRPEDVTISDNNGQVDVVDDQNDGPDGGPYAKAQRAAEDTLDTKIRGLLDIPNLRVKSTFVLDRDKGMRTVESKVDPKPVPLREKVDNRETSRGESGSPGGAPGLQPQGGGVNQPVPSIAMSGKGGPETTNEDKREVFNISSGTTTEKGTYDFAPKLAKVSIGIPTSYYEKIWRDKNPTKDAGDEKKPENQAAIDEIRKGVTQDVTAQVVNLLPTPPRGTDPATLVTVTTFHDPKPAEITDPAASQKAFSWLGDNWPMLAMVGLVLVSLGMLRSALRSVPAATAAGNLPGGSAAVSARVPAGEAKTEEKEEAVEVTAARRLRRITGSGPSLRDELSEVVKEDPDAAASILRTWIGQAN